MRLSKGSCGFTTRPSRSGSQLQRGGRANEWRQILRLVDNIWEGGVNLEPQHLDPQGCKRVQVHPSGFRPDFFCGIDFPLGLQIPKKVFNPLKTSQLVLKTSQLVPS